MEIHEPEHISPSEHTISPPPANTTERLKQLVEEHQLLNRLSQYPMINTVVDQTSDLYIRAKNMSPQVINNGLQKVESTLVDVISRPAPVNLTSVEEFGCRQLDRFDVALETPTGKSIQNLTSKIAHAGKVIVDKTPLRSRSSSQAGESDAPKAPDNVYVQRSKEVYNEVREKGFLVAMLAYFAIFFNFILSQAENKLSIPQDVATKNIKQGSEDDAQTNETPISDRAMNITAAVVYKTSRQVDEFTKNKISAQTKNFVSQTMAMMQVRALMVLSSLWSLISSVPYVQKNEQKINQVVSTVRENASHLSESFNHALANIEQSEHNKEGAEEQVVHKDTANQKSEDIQEIHPKAEDEELEQEEDKGGKKSKKNKKKN